MEENQKKVGLGIKLGYATGAGGYTLIQTLFASFTMVFYTTVFGIDPAAIGTMMLVARVWDAINDPMMGAIVDRTNTRWGKARPYIIGGAVPLGLFLIMTFSAPQLSNTAKLIWAYVGYIGLGMSMTVVQTAMFTLMPRLTRNPQESVTLNTWYMMGSNISGIGASLVLMPLLTLFSGNGTNMSKGYQILAIIFSAVSIIGFWILGFSAREIKNEQLENVSKSNKIKLKEIFSAVIQNDQLLVLCFIGLTGGLFAGISMGSNVLYLIYNLKDPNIYTFLMPIGAVTSILGTMSVPWLCKKMGKQKLLYTSIIFGSVFAGIRVLTHDQNITIMLILNGLSMLGMSVYCVFFVPMLTDAIDYGEWKTGKRIEGVVMTAYTFQSKFGLGLGGAIFGFALKASGFVANAQEQTQAVLSVLFHSTVTSQFLSFALLFVILVLFYKLNDKKMVEIRNELAERASVIQQ